MCCYILQVLLLYANEQRWYIQVADGMYARRGGMEMYVRKSRYLCQNHFDILVRVVSCALLVLLPLLMLPCDDDMSICADLMDIEPVKVECCRPWRILRCSSS